MFLLLGIAAIIAAIMNLVCLTKGKETKWFRFISLSLTALTMCDFYSDAARMVNIEDWSALMDVVPTISGTLWFCVICSILLNGISLFQKK